jgi:hypothetical protein
MNQLLRYFLAPVVAMFALSLQPSMAQQAGTPSQMPINSAVLQSDEDDFKVFPPPQEVILWGIGPYLDFRGTINTRITPQNPTSSPTFSVSGSAVSLDLRPQLQYGITLYAPTLFGAFGFNLDLGLSSYNFGTQYFTNTILQDSAQLRYRTFLASQGVTNPDSVRSAVSPKFFTTLPYLTVAPMLNIGGFLIGVNIGIPLFAGKLETDGSARLRFAGTSETIETSTIQLLIEPRIGAQVQLLKIPQFGTLFLNVNASYNFAFLNPPLPYETAQRSNVIMEDALRKSGFGFTDASFRKKYVENETAPGTYNYNSTRAALDTIGLSPLSLTVGLSFLLNFGNNEQVREILREEQRRDSIRTIVVREQGAVDYLRRKSITLADTAINTIIGNTKLTDRLNTLEQARRDSIAEGQKRVLRKEVTETKKKVFQAVITTVTATRDDGTETPADPTVRVEQFQATAQKPLLPVVFFEPNSSVIPSRYRRIQSAERESYKLPTDANASAFGIYPNVLNIIGKRMTTLPSSKLTITSVPSATETDSTIGGKRVEAIAQYFQDVWRISQSRLIRTAKASTPQRPAAATSQVELSSDNAGVLAPLTYDYIARLASPPVLNIGMEITTGLGLKQWELEFQQLVNNQLVTLKDTTGGTGYPERYLWRLNEEQGTIPQSNEPVNIRIAAYDVNNTAAPDAVLKSVRVEQVTMEQKRKANAQDKTVRNFDVLFGSSMTDLEPSSRVILDAVKKSITPQSKVFITVFGGTDDVNARKVAETLALDARSAVLRDAATSTTAQTPEAAAYGRLARIRVESPR